MPKAKAEIKTRQVTVKFDVQDNPQHAALHTKLEEACKAVAMSMPDFVLLCAHWGFEAAHAKAAAQYAKVKELGNEAWALDRPAAPPAPSPPAPADNEVPAGEGKRLPATKGPSVCKTCGDGIPVGEVGWWWKIGNLMQCEKCHSKEAA